MVVYGAVYYVYVKIKKHYIIIATAVILLAGLLVISNQTSENSAGYIDTGKNSSKNTPTVFNKKQNSIDKPGSIWWIVNKKRSLPSGYAPSTIIAPNVTLRLDKTTEEMKIRSDIATNIEAMFTAANKQGINLLFASGFRPQSAQEVLYKSYIAKDGQAAADRYSARPGTSEHQTGLAFDVCVSGSSCDLDVTFADTPAGKWVAQNAHTFGFIVRYPNGKEAITGYQYEPWHLRFVGTNLADELRKKNQTMEEFFSLTTK